MTDILFDSGVLKIYHDLMSCSNMEDKEGLAAAKTLYQMLVQDKEIKTVQEFFEKMNKASTLLKTTSRQISIKSGCDLYLRHATKSQAELEASSDFETCRTVLLNRGLDYIKRMEVATAEIVKRAVHSFEYRDTVLTHGRSCIIRDAMFYAHDNNIDFEVYVTQGGPYGKGNLMVKELHAHGIKCILIPDVTIGHHMDKISKVMLGCEAVLENAAVLGKIGTTICGELGKKHKLDVIILVETYKFSETSTLFNRKLPPRVLYSKDNINKPDRMPEVDLMCYEESSWQKTYFITDIGYLSETMLIAAIMDMYT